MRKPWSLAAKLGAIGSALLVVVLGSIGLTLWVTWKLEGGAAAINEAGRMRMQVWRLAQALPAGDAARIDAYLREFDGAFERAPGIKAWQAAGPQAGDALRHVADEDGAAAFPGDQAGHTAELETLVLSAGDEHHRAALPGEGFFKRVEIGGLRVVDVIHAIEGPHPLAAMRQRTVGAQRLAHL